MKSESYNIAGININVIGDSKVYELLAREFSGTESIDKDKKIDLQIRVLPITDFVDKQFYYSLSGKIGFDKNNYFVKEKNYILFVENIFKEGVTNVTLYVKKGETIVSRIKNIFRTLIGTNGKMNSSIGIVRHFMSYSAFMYIFHLVLLKKKKAFVHAGVVSINHKGYIFTGTSGCGKTSSQFELLTNKKYKYLADDFGIIDDTSTYYNPKKASVYQSDVKFGQIDFVNYIKNTMSGIDKMLWFNSKVFKKNPMRKISPPILLGKERIASKANIEVVYFFQRANVETVQVKAMDISEAVDRSLKASFREMSSLYEILYNIEAVGFKETNFKSFDYVINETKDIYTKAFREAGLYLVTIPLKAGPKQILEGLDL